MTLGEVLVEVGAAFVNWVCDISNVDYHIYTERETKENAKEANAWLISIGKEYKDKKIPYIYVGDTEIS